MITFCTLCFLLICKSLVFLKQKTYTFPLSFSPYYENKGRRTVIQTK